jgi:hypothetical protein
MDPDYASIIHTIASSSTGRALAVPPAIGSATIQLFHGTDVDTAMWIQGNGLNFEQMIQYCKEFGFGVEYFWATTRMRVACQYSLGNSAVMVNSALPAVVSFTLPTTAVTGLLSSEPPLVEQWSLEDADYRFRPEAFATVNGAMTNCTVVLTTEVKLDD